MMSGGQCVMTTGVVLMPPQSVDSWDTHTLEVRKPKEKLQCMQHQSGILIIKNNLFPGGQAFANAYFGEGNGTIFLDDVQCSSIATSILQCPSNPIGTHNCTHSDDAGVRCERKCLVIINTLTLLL